MKLKTIVAWLCAAGVGFAAAFVWVDRQQAARSARELETQRAVWEAEKADLQAALEKARARTPAASRVAALREPTPISIPPDPQALLTRLVALKVMPGIRPTRELRQLLALLGQLVEIGPPALPAIRGLLATHQDAAYEMLRGGNGPRDVKALTDALVPATLRFGLFEVVCQIGGEEAEQILAEALGRSGQGVELAFLTQLLEEMAPGQYRAAALTAARALLASASGADRDYLFSVLKRFGDDSYVSIAQTQLVQADGKVDRSALRYLQQTLGEKSVALVTQTYRDARVTEADSKEPLARVALAYVGAKEQAAELFHTAVLDQTLKPDHRRELVEDLNQDGLSSKQTPTGEDLKIIANRYALTQAYLQQDYVQNDKVLNAAFREADKDLAKLLQRAAEVAANPANAPTKPGP